MFMMHSIIFMNVRVLSYTIELIVRAYAKRGSTILNSYPSEYAILEYDTRKMARSSSDTLKCYRNINIAYGKK